MGEAAVVLIEFIESNFMLIYLTSNFWFLLLFILALSTLGNIKLVMEKKYGN